jgi:tryptophanase
VIEALADVYDRRREFPAYRFVSQAPFLRHFSARFEPVR